MGYFSVRLSLCDQNVASYIFANMCNVHVDSLTHSRALKPSYTFLKNGWLDGWTEISGRPYSKNGLSALASRGGRYVLIINFYVESGQKMIQFNIQFKIESKIFIQNGKINSKNYSIQN